MNSHFQNPDPAAENGLRQVELRWLRKYGAWFPLAGMPLGLLIGAELWRAVLLDPLAPRRLSDWLNPNGLAIGLFLAALPLLWRTGIWLEQRFSPRLRRWPIAPLLAVAIVLLTEGSFRTFLFQSIFWQSVQARAGNQHLAREISLLRLEAADPRAHAEPGFVLLGSSQLVYGIDGPDLAAQTGRPVYRRAVAGLFPTELVASQGWSDFNADNQLAMMLSGFDLGARNDLYPDAIRPLATPAGMRNLVATAGNRMRLRRWRSLIDLCFAAGCDLWRSRDYARFLLEHPFAPADLAAAPADNEAIEQQKQAYGHLGDNAEMVAWCQRALDRFFAEMSGRCRRIVVFEGRVSPAYPAENLKTGSKETQEFLLRQQRLGRIRYVPIEEQALDLPSSLWKDMTHVNDAGRRRLTDMFARVLSETPRAPAAE